jgi:hypothetical protein
LIGTLRRARFVEREIGNVEAGTPRRCFAAE